MLNEKVCLHILLISMAAYASGAEIVTVTVEASERC